MGPRVNLNASCLQNDSFLGTFRSQNLTGVPGHYVNLLCLCQRVLEPHCYKASYSNKNYLKWAEENSSPTGENQENVPTEGSRRREQNSGTRETLVSTYSAVQAKRPVFGSPASQHMSLASGARVWGVWMGINQ